MASFMDAVRTSNVSRLADINRRKSRLRGRPMTQAETAAPYEALASTAGQRISQARQLEQQDRSQDIQQEQFGERMQEYEAQREQQAALERERLAENKRQAQERMRFQQESMEEQLAAASAARERDEKQAMWQTGLAGAAIAGEYGGSIISGISKGLKTLGGGK